MSLAKINNFANDDTDILAVQTTVDALYNNGYTLTEYDSTTVPAIAAGSKIEVNGSFYRAATEEAISTTDPVTSATVADGTVYICMIPSGDASTCTAAFTATAPTWSDSKQGWYGTGDQANYRYLPELIEKSTASYKKHRVRPDAFPRFFNLISGSGELTSSYDGSLSLTMTIDVLSEKTSDTEITIKYSGFYKISGLYVFEWDGSVLNYKNGVGNINHNSTSLYSTESTRVYTTSSPGKLIAPIECLAFLSAGDVLRFHAIVYGGGSGTYSQNVLFNISLL